MRAKEYKNRDVNYNIIGGNGYLSNLKKINIFVGANNSGKSRFLRHIFKGKEDDFVFFDDVNNELNKIFADLTPRFKEYFCMKDLNVLTNSRSGNYALRFNEFVDKLNSARGDSSIGNVSDLTVSLDIKRKMAEYRIPNEILVGVVNNRHIYIPILRGLRHLDFQGSLDSKIDFYKQRTTNDYRLDIGDRNDVFSGLTVYAEIKKMLLGSREEREFIRAFENFLSKSFFQNKVVTLIPDHSSDALKINIDDGDDREIFNVGDGIQSIIIITFQAFKYQKEDMLLCIEEPEMMMHPSVQRVLIETLTTKFDKLQVFLTTHSNHFLDLTYDYPHDVTIFSFEAADNGKFNIKNVDDNARILDLLGVRNSSVFLSNCVVWTEGVTDRMLLRKLLELGNLKYKEDSHYSFAEYGGSNLENFDFFDRDVSDGVNVKSLTKINYLIADNDNIKGDTVASRKSSKYIRRKNVEIVLGEANFFDKHIEIENLVHYKVWLEVVKRLLADKPDKKINIKPIEDNAKQEANFNDELNNKKIGLLLKKYLIEANSNVHPKYFEEDSIQCLGEDKKKIMEYVIKVVDELNLQLSDFPQTTQDLVDSMMVFIDTSNKK